MSQPIMLFHASSMDSKVSNLRKHHLKDLKYLKRFDKKQIPKLRYNSPPTSSAKQLFILEAISDASMTSVTEGGARDGFLIMHRMGDI